MKLIHVSEIELSDYSGSLFFKHNEETNTSGAFLYSESAEIIARIPRALGTKSVTLNLKSVTRECEYRFSMNWSGFYRDFDVYSLVFDVKNVGVGIYFGLLEIESIYSIVYGYKHNREILFSKKCDENINPFQISISSLVRYAFWSETE